MRIGRATTNFPNLYYVTALDGSTGSLSLRNGATPVITLEHTGDSYFSGRMTIGPNGEIAQGTGTFGSVGDWTSSLWGTFNGYRVGRHGSIGRWALYQGSVMQVYATTGGTLGFGGGNGIMDANGIMMLGYGYIPGSAPWPPTPGSWPALSDATRGYKFRTANGNLLGGITGAFGYTGGSQIPTSVSVYIQDASGNDNWTWDFNGSGIFTSPAGIRTGRAIQANRAYIDDSNGIVNITTTGWKRLGRFSGSAERGFARVSIRREGGSAAPFHMVIEGLSSYTHTVGLGWIHCYGASGAPIPGVRITSDGTYKYLKANFTATTSDCRW